MDIEIVRNTRHLNEKVLEMKKKEVQGVSNFFERSCDTRLHEKLVEKIVAAKAKIMVLNYEAEPYDSVLSKENGWYKFEYETRSHVEETQYNENKEVLWCNYLL